MCQIITFTSPSSPTSHSTNLSSSTNVSRPSSQISTKNKHLHIPCYRLTSWMRSWNLSSPLKLSSVVDVQGQEARRMREMTTMVGGCYALERATLSIGGCATFTLGGNGDTGFMGGCGGVGRGLGGYTGGDGAGDGGRDVDTDGEGGFGGWIGGKVVRGQGKQWEGLYGEGWVTEGLGRGELPEWMKRDVLERDEEGRLLCWYREGEKVGGGEAGIAGGSGGGGRKGSMGDKGWKPEFRRGLKPVF